MFLHFRQLVFFKFKLRILVWQLEIRLSRQWLITVGNIYTANNLMDGLKEIYRGCVFKAGPFLHEGDALRNIFVIACYAHRNLFVIYCDAHRNPYVTSCDAPEIPSSYLVTPTETSFVISCYAHRNLFRHILWHPQKCLRHILLLLLFTVIPICSICFPFIDVPAHLEGWCNLLSIKVI